jgi:hypothetical protein
MSTNTFQIKTFSLKDYVRAAKALEREDEMAFIQFMLTGKTTFKKIITLL